MANSTTKVTKETATKKVSTKKQVPAKKVENKEKVQQEFISIQEATKLYEELGIKCYNPNAKGNYRIMGSKSSLNVKPKKGYYIYTSESDYDLIKSSKVSGKDLVIEKDTNSVDKSRPNTIICTTLETLKAVLGVYAQNPLNKVATK